MKNLRNRALAVLFLPALLIGTGTDGRPAVADEGPVLQGLAVQIMATVPVGTRVALRPFTEAETGLPQDVADRLYDRLLGGLFAASEGRHRLMEREELKALFASAIEFSDAEIQELLEAAKADVDILCDAAPTLDGIELSCRANDILQATIVGRGEATVPLDSATASVQPLETALIGIANDIWPSINDMGSISSEGIRDQQTGALTDLGTHVADRLLEQFLGRLKEAERQRAKDRDFQEAIAPGEKQETALKDYRLGGVIWTLNKDQIEITAKVKWQGRVVATKAARVARATVPESLRTGATTRGQFHEAVGEAVISARLDRVAATRAARNLARARVVAQAVGVRGPAATEVTDEADAATLISYLSYGIPVNERSRPVETDNRGGRIAISLRAQVVPVGSTAAPAITASLDKAVYRAMEPIRINVTSPVTAHLGIFAWGADNMVVRVYPNQTIPNVVVEPERAVTFPMAGEQVTIRSAPMPVAGNREDHEAFIIIASAAPFDFRTLAETVGGTLDETLQYAVPAPEFLSALGRADLRRTSVLFLPYQVHK